ncbi:MAG: AraC family protein [Porphyrobacter sp. HL-46]|nr:MAG: AraC family protein [Porphyrobacter sp. HL-46]
MAPDQAQPEAGTVPPPFPLGLDFIPAPPVLRDRVYTYFVIRTPAMPIADILPSYSAQFLLFVEGSAVIRYGDGGDDGAARSQPITLTAPMTRAAPFTANGPWLVVGASLTPLGWHALAGLPADEVHDCAVPAGQVLRPDQIVRIEHAVAACREGAIAPAALTGLLGEVVAAGPHRVSASHRRVIDAITQWRSSDFEPDLAQLQAAAGVSPRQLQRVCRRYLGVPPAQLLKRTRAIRAAVLLADPRTPPDVRDRALDSYFDQAHLIRDMRRYTGRTPGEVRRLSFAAFSLSPQAHSSEADPILSPARLK